MSPGALRMKKNLLTCSCVYNRWMEGCFEANQLHADFVSNGVELGRRPTANRNKVAKWVNTRLIPYSST